MRVYLNFLDLLGSSRSTVVLRSWQYHCSLCGDNIRGMESGSYVVRTHEMRRQRVNLANTPEANDVCFGLRPAWKPGYKRTFLLR